MPDADANAEVEIDSKVTGGKLLVCCNIADACKFYSSNDLTLVVA